MTHTLIRLTALLSLSLAASLTAAADLKPLPPKSAAALDLPRLEGGRANLADLRGRVVLVNYWAVWCPPCRKEMPSMERLAKKLADRPFTILAVNAGETPEQIREFLAEIPLTFPIVLDSDGARMKDWKVFVLPTSYLVDKQGRVRYGLTGSIEWDEPQALEVLEALLAE